MREHNQFDSIEMLHVSKRYGHGPLVLDDVSLSVHPDELVTVLGASGSGKTTLLMIVAGFEDPTGGTILVKGLSATGVPPQKRNLGVVFQNYALFPHLSVWQNVEFPLKVRGLGSREREVRVTKILDVVGLTGLAHHRPSQLSGGQQQRTALARALVFEPAALLLDEPLSALDRRLRESLQSEIKDVQERTGASILYVTHDQEEALRLSDRIAVIAGGRIAQVGTPKDVYANPISLFVAGCLGETNVLPCTPIEVDAHSVSVRFAMGEGRARRPPSGVVELSMPGVVTVRTEEVYFCDEHAAVDNHVRGVVREMSFLGSVVRYRVSIGTDEIVVRLPAAASARNGIFPEQAVTVGFNADAATFFHSS